MALDLYVLIRSANDQILYIEYNRHFTHSLVFLLFGWLIVAAFLFAAFLYLFFKGTRSFKQIYIFTTLGLATHGSLDAFTSYGKDSTGHCLILGWCGI